jgi:ribosomal subunit interface protein
MEITITARHCTVSEASRQRTERRLERLARISPRITSAAAIYEEDRGRRRVEVRMVLPGHGELLARGTGESFPDAVAQAAERLERQLKRLQGRVRARRTAETIRQPEPVDLA